MTSAASELAAALLPVARLRREQAPVRAISAAVAGCGFALALDRPWLWAWLAAYAGGQALELWALWPFRPERPAPGPLRQAAALAAVCVLAFAFGSLALLLWRAAPPVGPAAAVLLLCAGVLNVLATSRGCTPACAAGAAPYFLLLPALPWSGEGASAPVLSLTFAVAATAAALTTGLVWRESRRAQLSEAAALGEARAGQARAQAAWTSSQSFVAAVGHELRTPLTALTAAAAALEARALSAQNRSTAALIGRSAELMRRLLDDLLDLAKLEAGRMAVQGAVFSPRDILREAAELWAGPAQAKGVRLALEDADALPELATGDAHRLQQLLNNLLSNAVKFTDAGEVRIACAARPAPGGGWEATLTVTDTGRGLTQAEVAALFEPFAQGHAGIALSHGGTGLGLALSRQLARLMGGELTAYAGAGGRFELRLPLAAAATPAPAAAEAAAPPGWGARLRVLVVDDNRLAQRAVQVLLETLGAEVVTADGGAEALERLASEPFDLVLTDVHMDGMDGRETCRRLRASPGPNRDATVLALTGAAEPAHAAACLAAGMDGHLAKPVTASGLYAAVTGALAAGEARRGMEAAAGAA